MQQALAVFDPRRAQMEQEMAVQSEREKAEQELIKSVLGTVFSLRRPRDVVAGTASGLKTMGKGIGIGVGALAAQTYMGAKTEGTRGALKGMALGSLSLIAASTVGATVGGAQIVRGVINTPRAIVQKSKGQVWNSSTRKWEVDWYSLPEEAAEVLKDKKAADAEDSQGAGGSSGSSSRPAKKVADTTFYDLLDVVPEATAGEIRKAFYKKSLELHPDKNPDNPEATQKFQSITDAYRVLSDEDRRKAYDQLGKDSAQSDMPKIEPAVFFAALFGSHHFEPYVGRLRLALEIDGDFQLLMRDVAMATGEDDMPQMDILKIKKAQEHMQFIERKRQVKCAVDLAARLEPFVLASSDNSEASKAALAKWEKEQEDEANKLAKTSCGVEMLYIVGWIYSNRARQFFAGGVLSKIVAHVEGGIHGMHTKASLAGTVVRTGQTINHAMTIAEQKAVEYEKEEEEKAEKDKKEQEEGKDQETPGTTEKKDGEAAPDKKPEQPTPAAPAQSFEPPARPAAPPAGTPSAPAEPAAAAAGAAPSAPSSAGETFTAGPAPGQAAGEEPPKKSKSGKRKSWLPNLNSNFANFGAKPKGPTAAPPSAAPPPEAAEPGSSSVGGATSASDAAAAAAAANNGNSAAPENGSGAASASATKPEEETKKPGPELPLGTVVMLQNLVNAAELNNELGLVVGHDEETGRYFVQILPDVGMRKLKRENLIVVEMPDQAGGEGGAGGASASRAAGSAEGAGHEPDEDEVADAFKDCMPMFHDTIWSVTKLDIEHTLDRITYKLLKDMSVDKQVRKKRAEGLLKLGAAFQKPMQDRRKEARAARRAATLDTLDGDKDGEDRPPSPASVTSKKSTTKNVLTRFQPGMWKSRAERQKTQKAKASQEKQRRMEAAMAMMVTGASTEDVDEMTAAREAMEAEFEANGMGGMHG